MNVAAEAVGMLGAEVGLDCRRQGQFITCQRAGGWRLLSWP